MYAQCIVHVTYKYKHKIEVEKQTEDYTNLYKQSNVRHFYERGDVQTAVAALIFANFVANAMNAQGLFSGDAQAFYNLEIFFIVAFTIELSWNLYGSFWWPFWRDAWNWFDVVVVVSVAEGLHSRI